LLFGGLAQTLRSDRLRQPADRRRPWLVLKRYIYLLTLSL